MFSTEKNYECAWDLFKTIPSLSNAFFSCRPVGDTAANICGFYV
jgi:hypothetical protein